MLKDQILGTWRLTTYEAVGPHGELMHPVGRDAIGVLAYDEQGHVSVHIMTPGRALFAGGDLSSAGDAEFAAAARGYFAYYGIFEVDEAARTVTHKLEMCLVPNWVGAAQLRHAVLEGDRLVLSGGPVVMDGMPRMLRIVWERERKAG